MGIFARCMNILGSLKTSTLYVYFEMKWSTVCHMKVFSSKCQKSEFISDTREMKCIFKCQRTGKLKQIFRSFKLN